MPTYLYDHLTHMDQKWTELAEQKGIDFYSTLMTFCQADGCQITAEYDGVIMPIIWDYGHLTAAGSALLAKKIKLQKQQ